MKTLIPGGYDPHLTADVVGMVPVPRTPNQYLQVSLTNSRDLLRGFCNWSFDANLLLDPPCHTMEIPTGWPLSAQTGP